MFNCNPYSNGISPNRGHGNKLGSVGGTPKNGRNVNNGDVNDYLKEELKKLLEEEPDIAQIRATLEEWEIDTSSAKKRIKKLANKVYGAKNK